MSEAIKEAEKILKQYYGYDHFREGQIPVIKAVRIWLKQQRCAWNHADRSRKVGVLSGACTYDGRNYNRDLAADLTYERSGWNAEPDGSPCRFLK